VQEHDQRLEFFFSQSLDGFFFMMVPEPVVWNDAIDKDAALDYIFEHQRVTKANDAILAQYGFTEAQFLGMTPTDLFRHDLKYGRGLWRDLLDRGRLHVETDERRVDGTPIRIEGDYLCFWDAERRFTGHFGIQRDVTERAQAEDRLRQYNRRLEILHDTHVAILGSRSPEAVAHATLRHVRDLIPCRRSSVVVFQPGRTEGTIIAAHSEDPTRLGPGSIVPIHLFGPHEELSAGRIYARRDVSSDEGPIAVLAAEGLRSIINVPLLANGELIGVLNVGIAEDRAFGDDETAIARELADTLAVAIRQAQLREQIERHAAELEDRVAERTADLERSEKRLSAVVHALPDLVMVIDEDGRYIELLASTESMLYRPADEMKGRRFHDIFPPETADMFLGLVRTTLASRSIQVLEYPLVVPMGERWFEGRTSPLHLEIDGKRCIVFMVRDITDRKRAEELESQNVYLREELQAERSFGEIVGSSAAMRSVFKSIQLVASTDSTVLLLGETGTGKELIARAIQQLGRRRHGVMVKVNCGALPTSLAESELFGHERGAFTGAIQQKKGRFELAHRGTIFLDEVGELPLEIQVKLLRVLQEQELERVGATQTTKVDVRVIAATNRDLQEQVRLGAFRADLFYRLNIFPIQVPPLRERTEDVPLLAQHFVRELALRIGKPIDQIDARALARLTSYDWPGNVRELANVLERAVILCDGHVVLEAHIGPLGMRRGPAAAGDGAFPTLADLERQHILRALEQTGGVLAGPQGAARLLGMRRSTVWSRMRKLGIDGRKGEPPGSRS
jgi:PAS domain S-box-containing protein